MYPNSPSVTCIVSDGVTPFAITAGKELGIPVAVSWSFAACGFMGFYQYRALMEKGLTGFKDERILSKEVMEQVIDWIPGMDNIRLKDLPTFFQTIDPDDEIFNLAMESTEKAHEATALAIQTFDELEPDVLRTLSTLFPRVYTIGPLQLLLGQIARETKVNYLGYNLWEEDPQCLKWLDSKKPGSVVYVNFGSVTVMSNESLLEFAWGLANSSHQFLWIIRPDLVVGNSAVLPPEFEKETRGRSLIAGWCAQEEVLNHPSIGGFLTHCGWNSTIESLSAGVPMLCWPFFADQPTNCRYACTKWEVGMEIYSNVKRNEVEKLARELMGGEKGKKMKKKAMEWKEKAEEATRLGGSSFANLDKFVNVLLEK
uniref:Putative flavonoid UDP-glucosyltransferase n=1 Tax=Cyclamen purpurascens TaxID=87532 RepID=A0A8D5LTD4_9ERIC|nr:putative flavonoid UDP-glucosyltransferase [Cyclamen purpurascens]